MGNFEKVLIKSAFLFTALSTVSIGISTCSFAYFLSGFAATITYSFFSHHLTKED
jgi:hypothetical protein